MKLPISICIIANKTINLERCLNSVYGFASEIILADTGNGEVTQIANEYKIKTFRFEWCDDFAAARNATIESATQSWILILDSDEVLPASAITYLKEYIESDKTAYSVVTKNYTRQTTCTNWFPLGEDDTLAASLGLSGWFPSYKIRLFKNGLNLKFQGRVHELIKTDDAETAKFFIHHFNNDENKSDAWKKKKTNYLRLGQMKLAENPEDAQANFELGLQYSELEMYDQAIICLEKTIELNPNFGDRFYGNAYFELANIFSVSNDQYKAIKYFRKSIEMRPEHAPSYYNLAHLHQKANNYREAADLYKKAIEIDPKFAVAHNNLSNMLIESKDFDGALISAIETLKLNPKMPLAYQNASYALFELGRTDEAIALAQKALEEHPKDFGLSYNLARFFYKKKDLDNALKFLNNCVDIDPTKNDAYNHLAAIYIDLKLFKLAEKVFITALEKSGRGFDTLYNFAVFKIQRRRKEEAKTILEEAYKVSDTSNRDKILELANNSGIHIEYETKSSIMANLVFGMARGTLPIEDVHAVKLSFDTMDQFGIFIDNQYKQMFNSINTQTDSDIWELAIALLPPDQNSINSRDVSKHHFKTMDEGLIIISKYVKELSSSRISHDS